MTSCVCSPFQTHNILVFMSGLSKISLGEKSDTERVKKFSWHTAQKVSIPKIQCEWPMQLLLLFLETCTYSWAVCNKKSLESSGKWWTIKLFLCFFMLFPGMSSCFYLQLRMERPKKQSLLCVCECHRLESHHYSIVVVSMGLYIILYAHEGI